MNHLSLSRAEDEPLALVSTSAEDEPLAEDKSQSTEDEPLVDCPNLRDNADR